MTLPSESQGTPRIHFAVHGTESSGQSWINLTQTLRGMNVIWMPSWCTWRGQRFGHVIFAALLRNDGSELQVFSNQPESDENVSNSRAEFNLAGLILKEEILGQVQTVEVGSDQIYSIGAGAFSVEAINTRRPASLTTFVSKIELPVDQISILHTLTDPVQQFAVAA